MPGGGATQHGALGGSEPPAYLPALDGLRALGVVAVLLYHAGAWFARGAVFSISMFFTLSGFLITALALREVEAAGAFSMRGFWLRRFRRLLPAALVTLAGVVVFGAFAADEVQRATLRGDVIGALAYVANWRFVASDVAYLEALRTPSPVLHFWSLAIEEQFYLVFPLLVLAAIWLTSRRSGGAKALRWRLGLLAGGLWLVSAAVPFVFTLSADRIYLGTDTRASELLAGVVLGCLLSSRPLGSRRETRAATFTLAVLGPAALVGSLIIWVSVDARSDWIYQGGWAGYGVLSAVLIAAGATRGNPVWWLLDVKILSWVGRRSYGIYLFHFPIFLWLTPLRTGLTFWPLFGVRVALSVALAALSYRYLEAPLRRGDPLLGVRMVRLAPVVASLVVVGLVATTTEVETGTVMQAASYEQEFQQPAADDVDTSPVAPVAVRGASQTRPSVPESTTTTTQAPVITTTTLPMAPPGGLVPPEVRRPQRKLRLLILGDSTGVFLAYAIEQWNWEARVFDVSSYALMGCGLARGGTEFTSGSETDFAPICDDWPDLWRQAIDESKPDVIMVANGFHDVTDRRLRPGDDWTRIGEPEFDALLRSELQLAADILAEAEVPALWLDNPPVREGQNQPDAVMERPMNDPMRMARLDAEVAAVIEGVSNVHLTEYAKFFWTWPGGPFDPALRVDGLHVDFGGREVVGDWLGPQLLEEFWRAIGW